MAILFQRQQLARVRDPEQVRSNVMVRGLSREAAVGKLAEFLREPVMTERDRAGVIQAFEFSFEAT